MIRSDISSAGTMLLISAVVSAVAAGVSFSMFLNASADVRNRARLLKELRPASAEIKALEESIARQDRVILASEDLRVAVLKAIADIPQESDVMEELTSEPETSIPELPFRRRDSTLRIRTLTLVQLSTFLQNLRRICPSAAIAEAELISSEPGQQFEPELWNARITVSEFRYSPQ